MNPPPTPYPLGHVAQFLNEIIVCAQAQGFRVETLLNTADGPVLALTKRATGPNPRIYLSAGIHGDEPAPPQTLLALLKIGFFDHRAHWFICPVLNPVGLQRGIREDADERDLNRDYLDRHSAEVQAHTAWLNRQPPFDLSLCLHEDWESQGFYLYELNRRSCPGLAAHLIDAVKGIIPIETATLIDDRKIDEPGIIRPVSDPLLRENWPEAIYLAKHHTTLSYTLETPSGFPLAQRIAAMQAVVDVAIRQTAPA